MPADTKRTRAGRAGKKRTPTGRAGKKRTRAQRADKHVCYERAVQAPEADVDFINRSFRRLRARAPRVLREDFCGTAALCAKWVSHHRENRAYGIDLDEKTLNWGIQTHLVPLGKRAAGVTLIRQDVRAPVNFKADAIVAFNFSYCVFKDRATLRGYLESARKGLKPDGLLYMDIFGGPESMDLREERTEYDGFTYVWDQDAFNPITYEIKCHIHFEFPDRSRMRRAFTYDWRLWQIPEIRDIALEAGFRDFLVYWEGIEHATGEGNGVFRVSQKGDNAEAFVSYLVCVR